LFIASCIILLVNISLGSCIKENQASEKELKEPLKIDSGYISGATVGEPGKEVHVYLGIPYAAPPTGDLRWKPPQPAASWPDVRACTTFGTQAPQAPGLLPAPVETSEDCLWLSVMTPAKNTTDKLPVMVCMHGGGYSIDTAANPTYNNFKLPQHGVVQVNVNMRLGVMGLLAHPLLSEESPNGVSGNYMFLDMILALKWVQKNIAVFGGDPNNVTLWGYSGGSCKVIYLMASPLAKGLFHKAICQSGTPTDTYVLNPRLMKAAEMLGEKLFAKLRVDKVADPLTAARAMPWEKIIEADSALAVEAGGLYDLWGVWDLSLDGWFMPDSPLNIFQAGKQNAVPFIVGGNLGEITGPGMILMPGTIPDYVKMLSSASKVGVKGYAYIFDHVPSTWKQEGCISTHAMETVYMFGNVDIPREWALLSFLTKQSGAKSDDPGVTDVDRKVAEEMMSMWAQFIRTGDPSVKGLVTWPAYEASSDQYLYIADPLEVKIGFSKIGPDK
jgi:para-nitrobenzyl esterase